MKTGKNKKPCVYSEGKPVLKMKKGLDASVVGSISGYKEEPEWMRSFRLKSFLTFQRKNMPLWGADLSGIDFDDLCYYLKPTDGVVTDWNQLPKSILETYEKIGVPEAEKKFLSGVSAQYESEVVYKSIQKTLKKKGVIFLPMDEGLKQCPDLVRKYFGTLIPPGDNIFSALNSSVWSGGTFLYVPRNMTVGLPLQAYFRINAEKLGQFERTLIIAEEGSSVHYVEGCTASIYSTDSLHAGVVEIFVGKGARVRYTTVQNWSTNVYNLVTKRALVDEEGVMEWIDGNLGSKVTMKYPAVILSGKKAHGDILSIASAGSGQVQDAGAKAIHMASETTSRIVSKSVSRGGGQTSYRGMVKMIPKAENSVSHVVCDALILDSRSRSDTYPLMDIAASGAQMSHEAAVSKISDEQLLYLVSRGIPEEEAMSMIVNGFIDPIVRELPLEYAVELNRLIGLHMEGSVG